MANTCVRFESNNPHKDKWLWISFPVDSEPTDFLMALQHRGWSECPSGLKTARVSPVNGIQEITMHPPQGSGLFGIMTDEERSKAQRDARTALNQFGWNDVRVPHYKMDFSDCI